VVRARTDQGEESELARDEARRRGRLVAMTERPTKITFGEMRDMGVRGVLIYCSDYKRSHSIAVNADRWPDDVRLSNIEERFVGSACGKRGADVRPDFNWNRQPMGMMGFR
jgi:hypothetical protein